MQINNDFLMRKLGAVAVQPPMLKDEVTDEVFLNILGKVGQHQKMMVRFVLFFGMNFK